MPELQHKPLFHETEYAIDVMLDDMMIDGATATALRMYGNRDTINGIVDNKPMDLDGNIITQWQAALISKRAACYRLTDYATEIINELPLWQQGAFASVGLSHMHHVTLQMAEFLARSSIGDLAEGGYMQRHNHPPRAQRGTALPYKKDWRRLHAPKWIRRYVKLEAESHRSRELASRVLDRVRPLDHSLIYGGIEAFRTEIEECDRRRRAYEAQQGDAILAGMAQGETWNEAYDAVRVRLKPGFRKRLRNLRRVARRGLDTAATIIGQDGANAFVRGEPVIIEGVNLKLAVQRRGRVADAGHGTIKLEALDMENRPLADLCFYIEDTPAIDQLTALALHVQAGEEDAIISASNLISTTSTGLTHPAFEAKRTEQALIMARNIERPERVGDTVVRADGREWTRISNFDYHEAARQRDKDYWQSTKHLWTESLGVFMLGPKYHKMAMQQGAEA